MDAKRLVILIYILLLALSMPGCSPYAPIIEFGASQRFDPLPVPKPWKDQLRDLKRT